MSAIDPPLQGLTGPVQDTVGQPLLLRVGIKDVMPRLIVYKLIESTLAHAHRQQCSPPFAGPVAGGSQLPSADSRRVHLVALLTREFKAAGCSCRRTKGVLESGS